MMPHTACSREGWLALREGAVSPNQRDTMAKMTTEKNKFRNGFIRRAG